MTTNNQIPNRLLGNLDDLLTQTLRSFGPAPASRLPDIYRNETEDAYQVRLDLPGFTKEEVTVVQEKNGLKISAKSEREDAFRDDYEKTFNLPEDVDLENIGAKLENGVLNLTFPKAKKEETTRNIELS